MSNLRSAGAGKSRVDLTGRPGPGPLAPASRLRLGPAPLRSLRVLPCRPPRRSRPRSSRRSGNRPRAPGWTRRCGEPGRRRGGPGPGLHPLPRALGAPPPAPLPARVQGPAVGAVPRPWPGPQPRSASHGRVPGAQAGSTRHGCGPSPIPGAGAPAPALENGRFAKDPGPAPAAPACWARVDTAPLRSAQGLGLGRAAAVEFPGAGGQAGSPLAEAGGRAAAAAALGFAAGAQAPRPARGGAEPGLCLTPSSPATKQRPRPLGYAPPTVGRDALGEWVRGVAVK